MTSIPERERKANEAWKDSLRPHIQLLQRLDATEDGKALFALLENAFENRTLMAGDPHQTYYNLGQRDVVQYMRELRDYQYKD